MKKVSIILLSLLLVGCSNNKQVSINDSIEEKELLCNGSSEMIDKKISLKLSNNTIVSGKYIVKLTLDENADEEEKEMLKNISLCSTDMMGDILNLGKCTTKIEDNVLTSTLTIDKKMSAYYKISMKDLKKNIEKSEIKTTCISE